MNTPKKKGILNYLIQYTLIFFLVFLLVDYFLIKITPYSEGYIPALGSNSKIIINRMTYQSKTPSRWDLVYLESPHINNERYIRRIIGLPNEKILIKKGDVYINDKIAQKSNTLQKGLWVNTYDLSSEVKKTDFKIDQAFSTFQKESWVLHPDGSLVSHLEHDGVLQIAPNCYTENNKSAFDIRLKFELKFNQDQGRFFILFRYSGKNLAINIPSTSIGKNAHIQEEQKIIKSISNIRFLPGITHQFEFWLYDQKLEVFHNSKRIFLKNWGYLDKANQKRPTTEIFMGCLQSSVALSQLSLARDISFEDNGRFACDSEIPYKIGDTDYFLITDHPDSSETDSRQLGSIDKKQFKGKAVMTLFPNFLQWVY